MGDLPTSISLADREAGRRALRRARARLPADQAAARSLAIARRLFALPPYRGAGSLLVYLSAVEREVSTDAVVADALARGVALFTPVIAAERRLELTRLRSLDDLEAGPLGIPQVRPDARAVVPPDAVEAAVLPGVAFDRQGNRLGMGAGYFDRFLHGRSFTRIALGYAFQLVERVEPAPWDEPMDFVVTEEGVVDCGAGGAADAAP